MPKRIGGRLELAIARWCRQADSDVPAVATCARNDSVYAMAGQIGSTSGSAHVPSYRGAVGL